MHKSCEWKNYSVTVFVALVLSIIVLMDDGLAAARPWKPTPQALALDYAEIAHQRGSHDLVFVIWLVPQMLGVASEEIRDLLDKYTIIGAVQPAADRAGRTRYHSRHFEEDDRSYGRDYAVVRFRGNRSLYIRDTDPRLPRESVGPLSQRGRARQPFRAQARYVRGGEEIGQAMGDMAR
jgi:hypothetical protein